MMSHLIFSLVFFVLSLSGNSHAAPVETPHARVELLTEKEAATPGETQWLGVHIKPEDGWHVYWQNPGDSGLPPRGELVSDPSGSKFGPIQFPTPARIPYGPLVNFGYPGEVLYPLKWEMSKAISAGENITITANLKWLICKEECVPGRALLKLALPVIEKDKYLSTVGTNVKLFQNSVAALPANSNGRVRVSITDEKIDILYSPEKSEKFKLSQIFFFPESDYGIRASTKQIVKGEKDGIRISIPRNEGNKSPIGEFRGNLKVGEDRGIQVSEVIDPKVAMAARTKIEATPASYQINHQNSSSLALMLLFAFIGGIILNLMPCILPVLSIKILGLANQSGENRKQIQNHGLIFTLGVMVSFWILTAILLLVRTGGQSLGWGFQLQSPVFVAILALLFFLMALNLFGFFEIGSRFMGLGGGLANQHSYSGSFFTGVLTTVAATPCSAPFMGTALGFALTQPAWVAVIVLTTLGFGLSLPYLAFSYLPSAAKLLPKPGAWMKTLKEVLAFPLLASVVWLVGVLGNQVGSDGVISFLTILIFVTAVIWLFNLSVKNPGANILRWVLILALLVISLLTIFGLSESQEKNANRLGTQASSLVHEPWKEWSPAALESALIDKKTVLVNITADWCVTCKLNETLVFARPVVITALKASHVVPLLADWTNGDPIITEYIAKYGRNSVPVYLLYREGSREPEILSQILSSDLLIKDLGTSSR